MTPLYTMTVTSVLTMIPEPATISGLLSTILFLDLAQVDRTFLRPTYPGTNSLLLLQRTIVVREPIMGRILATRIIQPLQMITEVPPAKAVNQVNMSRIISAQDAPGGATMPESDERGVMWRMSVAG